MAILTLPIFIVPNAHPLSPPDPTILVAAIDGEPQNLDPAWSWDLRSDELLMNIYDSLIGFNRTDMTTFIPRLATSWWIQIIDETSPEGLHWVARINFTIRTGVHFQYYDGSILGEGAILTPQDVEYTFERMLITDCLPGPSWMFWEPLTGGHSATDLNATLDSLRWLTNATTHWSIRLDDAIDHAIESDATHVWFNLIMPYEPFLQIVARSQGGIMNQAWCVWHDDWPGMSVTPDDEWYKYYRPATSPLYSSSPASPGPNLDAALGTGPYMLDYWIKGVDNAWSIIKNPNYWEGWAVPFAHEGWGVDPADLIQGHVDRYTSYDVPDWNTRKLLFLGGQVDFCVVSTSKMEEVLDQPGIHCDFPLPQLWTNGCFFNFKVSSSSTHMGVMQPPGTFNQYGAPPDMMSDLNFRLAICHMFDYTTYLEQAFLNESISPVTPIIPGLAYYDPSIGQMESPAAHLQKKCGITGEPAGQLAYDLDLAKTYLQNAWGGQLWTNGFTMDVTYSEGSVPNQIAARLVKLAFEEMNAMYGTMFTINVVSISWDEFLIEEARHSMPLIIDGRWPWFPDAHQFAFHYMHSAGGFAGMQGYLGVTSFPNEAVDSHINDGIATINPAERQGNYTWLQHYYVDNAPGFVISQPSGRHFQSDWVRGWYYNPMYPGNYVYDLWKQIPSVLFSVDVAVADFPTVPKLEIGFPVPTNHIIRPNGPIFVTVARLDANVIISPVEVVIGVGLKNATNIIILGIQVAHLNPASEPGDTFTAKFDTFRNTVDATIVPGIYTIFAEVLLVSHASQDIDLSDNHVDQAPAGCEALLFKPDVNVDGTVDMADISSMIDAFMETPGSPLWDPRCDVVTDNSIDMADIAVDILLFMLVFDP